MRFSSFHVNLVKKVRGSPHKTVAVSDHVHHFIIIDIFGIATHAHRGYRRL
jgi:hypothetical protein